MIYYIFEKYLNSSFESILINLELLAPKILSEFGDEVDNTKKIKKK